MSVDLNQVADRVSRNLEEQRRKLDSYSAMMDEVESSSEDSEDDAPVRRRKLVLAAVTRPLLCL
jgi:hypothetical protein